MRIATLLLVHTKPEMASRLIRLLLSDPDFTVFIHVDKKAESVYLKLKETFKDEQRVNFTRHRFRIYWGSIHMVYATLQLIKEAVTYGEFDYFNLMSGQDLPIKPLSSFKQFLTDNYGKEFLCYTKLPYKENFAWKNLDRLELFWVCYFTKKPRIIYFLIEVLNFLIHCTQKIFGLHKKLRGDYYAGSQWFVLSRNAMNYILAKIDKNPKLLKRYKNSSCSDEFFFTTLIMNSNLKDNVVNNNLMYLIWPRFSESPKTLRIEDIDNIISSQNKFFARKFDDSVDSKVINKIIATIK